MRGYRRLVMGRPVIINLTTGRAFRGVLCRAVGQLLELRNAELIEDDRVVPVEGSVVVERSQVDFIQVRS